MRTVLALLTVLASGLFSAARAEDIIFPPKDFRGLCSRTTLIDILRVPDLKAKDLPATVDLAITSWDQGMWVDATGRTWVHFRGPIVSAKPEKFTGWVLFSVYRQEFFFTTSGTLFRIASPHEICCAKGNCKKPALKDLKDKIEAK